MARARKQAAEPGNPLVFGEHPEAEKILGIADIPIETPDAEMVMGASVKDTEDGGIEIDLEPKAPSILGGAALPHDANLLEAIEPNAQADIAGKLVDQIDADWKSSEEWRQQTAEGIKLLGVKIEKKDYPFPNACAVTDPLLLEALIRFQATARGEMLPPAGPVKAAIAGISTPEIEDRAARIQAWMNYYLTEQAPEFYPDYDQMLFWTGLVGSTFKKVYQDPLMRRPVSPFLTADDLVVSYNTTHLQTCPRVTHKIQMYNRDVKALQMTGFYAKVDLPEPSEESNVTTVKAATDNAEGRTPIIPDRDGRTLLYESHVDWDIPGFEHKMDGKASGLPVPYRITVEKETRKLLAVYRNWKEGDEFYRKRNFFVHYKFLPGLGFYGFGLCHTLGQHTQTATTILRQLIDAGTLASFPGGVRAKGVRMTKSNILVGPTEFAEIDTGGLPLEQAIKPFPYKEPSQQLRELRGEVVADGRRVANTSEISVGDGRQDAPVGTTMALLEAATRVESGTIKRIHNAMRDELRLFSELFGEHLQEKPYPFPVQGGMMHIMRADFAGNIDVMPVSDPSYGSQTQRLVKAEARLRLAMQAPQIHEMREVFKDVYVQMGVDLARIEAILPEPKQAVPMDPLSENMNAIMGKPVAVGPWQDDEAHIAAHQAVAMQVPTMGAHIAEHMAQSLRKKVQAVLGMNLPAAGAKLPPELENEVAGLVARAMEVIKQQSGAPGTQSDPQTMAIQADLQARAQETAAKLKIAEIRHTTEMQKAILRAQTESERTKAGERKTIIQAFASTADNQAPARPEATALLSRIKN